MSLRLTRHSGVLFQRELLDVCAAPQHRHLAWKNLRPLRARAEAIFLELEFSRMRHRSELDDFHAGQKLFVAIWVALFGNMSLMAGLQ